MCSPGWGFARPRRMASRSHREEHVDAGARARRERRVPVHLGDACQARPLLGGADDVLRARALHGGLVEAQRGQDVGGHPQRAPTALLPDLDALAARGRVLQVADEGPSAPAAPTRTWAAGARGATSCSPTAGRGGGAPSRPSRTRTTACIGRRHPKCRCLVARPSARRGWPGATSRVRRSGPRPRVRTCPRPRAPRGRRAALRFGSRRAARCSRRSTCVA